MLDLSNVTLVSMTSILLEETIDAMIRSCECINYGKIKFISNQIPSNLPSNFEFCQINRINNIDEYSYNMIYNLGQFIDTDYALVVQSDGYVINPDCWRDEFFEYDYIGAPWIVPNLNDTVSFRDLNGTLHRVGNGGFSLRSKKLIDLPNILNMKWESYRNSYNEDGFICVFKRDLYEQYGCKIATMDIAKYFAHEAEIPEIQGIRPFGFHGKWSKYKK